MAQTVPIYNWLHHHYNRKKKKSQLPGVFLQHLKNIKQQYLMHLHKLLDPKFNLTCSFSKIQTEEIMMVKQERLWVISRKSILVLFSQVLMLDQMTNRVVWWVRSRLRKRKRVLRLLILLVRFLISGMVVFPITTHLILKIWYRPFKVQNHFISKRLFLERRLILTKKS